ncbi:hypothetical protein CCACVL1_27086 [Corchorus capsularis]|uniref:Uncharacterized protein n=1 Tax=Corchorus capsularis TaxID=210143 RepID=A0A1R3GC96_COCAP|nr:hypothetical protein CCACVL1_27086 [Corchorus capsularis]
MAINAIEASSPPSQVTIPFQFQEALMDFIGVAGRVHISME